MSQRLHCTSILLACSLLAGPQLAAAESAPPAAAEAGACYGLLPAERNTLPGSPMLINKCSGQTYVLTRVRSKEKSRDRHEYRWQPIDRVDRDDPLPAVAADHKCFSFDGRKFCP